MMQTYTNILETKSKIYFFIKNLFFYFVKQILNNLIMNKIRSILAGKQGSVFLQYEANADGLIIFTTWLDARTARTMIGYNTENKALGIWKPKQLKP